MGEISVAEQRYQAVLAVLQDGLSVTAVAEKMGVSRQSLYRWMARYEAPQACAPTLPLGDEPTVGAR